MSLAQPPAAAGPSDRQPSPDSSSGGRLVGPGDPLVVTGPHGVRIELDAAGHLRRTSVTGSDGELQASLFLPGVHDRPVEGVWLRRRSGDAAEVFHLTGAASGFGVDADGATWSGTASGVPYLVRLTARSSTAGWQWRVWLDGTGEPGEFDLVVVHDVALADPGAARTNELYASHYVAHELVETPRGPVVASRQTMMRAPQLPLHVLGWAEGSRGATTDAFDLVGPGARLDAVPRGLACWDLGRRVRQYEHAQVALASASFSLDTPVERTALVAVAPDVRDELATTARLLGAADPVRRPAEPLAAPAASVVATAPLLQVSATADPPSGAQFVESDADGALSWFGAPDAGCASHTATARKEALVERSHGQVLVSCASIDPAVPAMTVTAFAPGIFASHVALGNTNLHRVVDVHRDSLGLLRTAGLRLLVDLDGGWRLLGVPTTFTMGWGDATWTYAVDGGPELVVRTVVGSGEPVVRVRFTASAPVRVMATLSLDADTGPWQVSEDAEALLVVPGEGHAARSVEPGLAYAIGVRGGWRDDAELFADATRRGDLWVAGGGTTDAFEVTFTGSLQGSDAARAATAAPGFDDWAGQATAGHARFASEATGGLVLESDDPRLAELAVITPWLAHDAVVHFVSPHGLEQFSGAAWGTRDVCQGPFELALATGRGAVARDVLVRVLDHQFANGDFPQWFMFDGYRALRQDDSHGDVPVWPLVALAEYLRATGDVGVLDEPAGWLDADGTAPLSEHVARILGHITSHEVPGTGLYAFGEGDWDDTLQPADPAGRRGMVSSWTNALVVEACEALSELLPTGPLAERAAHLGARTRDAFERLLVIDGRVPGLARFTEGRAEYLIHPADRLTGERHRLISLTEALFARLLDEPDQQRAVDDVRDHLTFPDGVRLMDRPLPWHEGVPRIFRRAEQSAFFGREVGLLYTHAHLRWVQALAGRRDVSALDVLLQAVPVQTHQRLGDLALPRQRNCYFSSSDARFATRSEASERWDALRAGEVPVAGGWRVYSSGPGIMVRLLLQELLGVHRTPEGLLLDPVLPADLGELAFGLDGLRIRYLRDLGAGDAPRVDGAHATVDGSGVHVATTDVGGVRELTVHLPRC